MLDHLERRRFTPEEYLMLEERSELKSEYYDGEIYQMTGGTLNHNRIVTNLATHLSTALSGSGCEVFQSDVRLLVERWTLFTYPDLMIVYGPPRLLKGRRDTLTDARVIIEVLSPSTESYDRGDKFKMYGALPSLVEFVLVSQDEHKVESFLRQQNGPWVTAQSGEMLRLSCLELEIPVAAAYKNVV